MTEPSAEGLTPENEPTIFEETLAYAAGKIDRLEAENKQLRASVVAANANHEKFERLWYLEKDKREELESDLTALRSAADELRDTILAEASNPFVGDDEFAAKWGYPKKDIRKTQAESLRRYAEARKEGQ